MIKELLAKPEIDINMKDSVNRTLLEAAEYFENYDAYQIIQEALKTRKN